MTIFRYAYFRRFEIYDEDAKPLANPGIFDFSLEDVTAHLTNVQEKLACEPCLSWPTQSATNIALLKLIEWMKQENASSTEKILVWHHPTRDWGNGQYEQEKRRWSSALNKWSDKIIVPMMNSIFDVDAPEGKIEMQQPANIPPQAYLPDSILHYELNSLIYERKFLAVGCPTCKTIYKAKNCEMRTWNIEETDAGGEKIVCPQKHVLHARWTGGRIS